MARSNLVLGTGLAAGIGALDGVAASRDTQMGRSWDSPGVGSGGGFVLKWGWAPVVQVLAVGLGAVGAARGSTWGDGTLCAGAALLSRAAAFRLMNNRSGMTPMPVQGMVARPFGQRPVYPGGGYDNSWDGTSPGTDNSPGNAYRYTPSDRLGGTDQAYLGGPVDATTPAPGDSPGNGMVRYAPGALGPVTAHGWSGVPGQYGAPQPAHQQQSAGIL